MFVTYYKSVLESGYINGVYLESWEDSVDCLINTANACLWMVPGTYEED